MADPQRDPYPHCDVCERTILKGEETHEYVTSQGQRLSVCVLCRPRAEASGWIPADQVGAAIQAPPSRTGPADALRKRLGRAAARARATARPRNAGPRKANGAKPSRADDQGGAEQPAGLQAPAPARGQPPGARKAAGSRPASKRQAKRQPKRAAKGGPAGEAAPKKPRPRRGPEALMRRGVQRFNGSDETRKVAGLIRSLGEPRAGVSADAGRQLALVTVAWELSWYQWEVTSDGNGEPVREVAKGDEVSELAEDEPKWNAAVAEDGKLRLKAASTRRKPSAKSA